MPVTPRPRAPLISGIVRRLVDVYRPERIYLFGSAARGDAGPDSDYDFMVVVSDDTPRETRETKAVLSNPGQYTQSPIEWHGLQAVCV